MITVLGLVAACLTTGAWLPQLARTWRIGHADEISVAYLAAFGTGVGCWLVYGVVSDQVAVVAANAVTLVLVAGLCILKARPRHREDAGAAPGAGNSAPGTDEDGSSGSGARRVVNERALERRARALRERPGRTPDA